MQLTEVIMRESLFPLKCPYSMIPIGICVHNTANSATAREEKHNMEENDPTELSFHIVVDEKEALQMIPFDRNAWHAGDGLNGEGNRKYISIEICYSSIGGDLFAKAEANAAIIIAQLMRKFNFTIDNIKRHYDFSGKDCPHLTMLLGWDRFLNMIKKDLDENGLEVPKNLPKFTEMNYQSGEDFSKRDKITELKGLTLYCIPQLFTYDDKKNDIDNYDQESNFYNANAYTKDCKELIDKNSFFNSNGYHIFIDGKTIIHAIPQEYKSNHLKDNSNNTYIHKNLYNNDGNSYSVAVVMMMPKNTDYKDIETMTAKYIATFLLKNRMSMDYFMRSFDLDRSPYPLHLLDKEKWEKFVSRVSDYYSAIQNGKYKDEDLKDLDDKKPVMSDEEVRQFYFLHLQDYNEYAKNFEPDDRGIDRIVNPNNADNMGNQPDEISSFQSKNKVDFAYTVSEKAGENRCDCDSPYDSLTVKATPITLEVEPIYPDTIVPPGGTITLVNSLNPSNSDVTSNVQLTLDEFKKRQQTFNAKDYKDAKKESNKGKPVNNNDPFPVDSKIEELESHTPKIKIDEVNYKMLECNHTGSQLAADVSKDLGMIQDQLLTIAKRTERRIVKLENTMATIMRNLFRVSARMQINCVYYGGQDVYAGKYKCIRCLRDDRINDGQSMTLDQCLSCTRYEPIIGQVYAILDETGTNITQILDDNQMAYMNMDDYIKFSRTEEMFSEKSMINIQKENNESPKQFSEEWDEGFKMDWTNVPLETQKPNIAEYKSENMEASKPTIKTDDKQPDKVSEFVDKRENNTAYEELKFNSDDYNFGRFSKANSNSKFSNTFGLSGTEVRNKIVEYAKSVVERCKNGKARYSQAYRGQEIDGILYYDCSSFTQACYMKAGLSIAGIAGDQYAQCYSNVGGKLFKISDVNDALPGDLIFFDYNGIGTENPDEMPVSSTPMIPHVGLYIGDGLSAEAMTDEMPANEQIGIRKIEGARGMYAFGRPKVLVEADQQASSMSTLDDAYWNIEYHHFSAEVLNAAMRYVDVESMRSNIATYGYKDIVNQKAKEHNHDPYVLLGIIGTESNGNPDSANSAYGGLMGTSMSITNASNDIASITQQIENGCNSLTEKEESMANLGWPDDICLAIYAYNAGQGTVKEALDSLGIPHGTKVKGGEIADAAGAAARDSHGWSYEEKQTYFAKVLDRYIEYKKNNLLS